MGDGPVHFLREYSLGSSSLVDLVSELVCLQAVGLNYLFDCLALLLAMSSGADPGLDPGFGCQHPDPFGSLWESLGLVLPVFVCSFL